VIDDALAFSGGLDLTIRRWDTSNHALNNRSRVDPGGRPYRPFHDVQAMVDGEAASALSDIVKERWWRVTSQRLPSGTREVDPWPKAVAPDFADVQVRIPTKSATRSGRIRPGILLMPATLGGMLSCRRAHQFIWQAQRQASDAWRQACAGSHP
jgi:phospholipase D1/2